MLGSNSGWSYSGNDGPAYWAESYPPCGGENQSPINIDTSSTEEGNLGTFTFVGFGDVTEKSMKVTNNGHSLQVSLTGDYSVSGGGLGGTYNTDQFHFHWGSSDAVGSEHKLNNAQYPAEMHMVHYNSIYSSTTDAIEQGGSTGLAVLGFFFQVSNEDNSNFETLLNSLTNVQEEEATYDIPANDVFTLESLLPDNLGEFYRYNGSLTTPNCAEAIIWTMFKEPISLSSSQIQMFRTLQNSHNETIEDTFRPVQALNGRTVIYSDPDYEPSHSNIIAPSIMVSFLTFLIFSVMK
ncbi:carbonic anhydrase 2-like [Antedon mediterranea]|uniref:carbonic anhydrase 2-like n=1 Tax=Antedon mediterranea TaxID=105859 RepID=UPI003AF94561